MKKALILAAAASALFAFAGCSKDAIDPITPDTPSSELATITATTAPQEDETRTSFSDGDILWTEGDQIALRLAAAPTYYWQHTTYTLKTGAGTTKGTFEGDALPVGAKYALYPQSIYSKSQSNINKIDISLPEVQLYKAGSFGNGANPMVAKSDAAGENLAFLNIYGAIRLRITGNATVTKISVTSAGEPIVGVSKIDMTYTDDPQVQILGTGTTVFLSNINEPLNPSTPKEFTIILPPGEYAAGMYFSIETSDGQFMNKVTTAPITVTRSKILPLAAFDVVAKPYNFPDKNFRAYLKERGCVLNNEGTIDEDIDINDETNKEKFNSVTSINCESKSIASLKGIEYFTALTILYCYDNSLTSLDLSANTELTELYCENNQVTKLDVTKNTALIILYSDNSQLSSLDLPASTTLTQLSCLNNKLTSIDLTKTTALTDLYCANNRLSMLDLTHNTVDLPSYSLWIGAQVAADGTLLDMKAYVSDKQTSELDTRDERNARATLSRDPTPTPGPPMR